MFGSNFYRVGKLSKILHRLTSKFHDDTYFMVKQKRKEEKHKRKVDEKKKTHTHINRRIRGKERKLK